MDNQHSENPVTAREILDRKARLEARKPKFPIYSKEILSTAIKQLGMINLRFMNADFQHVIQAKCAIEQVLREWPPATEYQLKQNPTEIDSLNAEIIRLMQQNAYLLESLDRIITGAFVEASSSGRVCFDLDEAKRVMDKARGAA